MRIVIPTTGSRGDVQPYVALGTGLQAAGHEVRLATHEDFEPFVRAEGLDFYAMAGSSQALHASEEGQQMIQEGDDPLAFMGHFSRMRVPIMNELIAGCLAACADADLIVLATSGFMQALSVAEKLGKPMLAARYLPMTPNRAMANCLVPPAPAWLPGGGVYNYLTHLAVAEAWWQFMRKAINQARQEVLDLPPYPFLGPPMKTIQGVPAIHGYSEHVLPRPAGWAENQLVTGFWFLDTPSEWQPPAGLVDFLEAGPPPVAIGFGSMHNLDPAAFTRLVLRALAKSGQRAVLLTGWGGLDRIGSTDQVFVTPALPHDWLFPRMAAVVHHGGAGTSAAVLRAGVPSVVVPFMADQPFWGRRLFELGVGPRPISRRLLSPGRLAEAITQAVQDTNMRHQAATLGAKIRSEDGLRQAAEVLERYGPSTSPRKEAGVVIREEQLRIHPGQRRRAGREVSV